MKYIKTEQRQELGWKLSFEMYQDRKSIELLHDGRNYE